LASLGSCISIQILSILLTPIFLCTRLSLLFVRLSKVFNQITFHQQHRILINDPYPKVCTSSVVVYKNTRSYAVHMFLSTWLGFVLLFSNFEITSFFFNPFLLNVFYTNMYLQICIVSTLVLQLMFDCGTHHAKKLCIYFQIICYMLSVQHNLFVLLFTFYITYEYMHMNI